MPQLVDVTLVPPEGELLPGVPFVIGMHIKADAPIAPEVVGSVQCVVQMPPGLDIAMLSAPTPKSWWLILGDNIDGRYTYSYVFNNAQPGWDPLVKNYQWAGPNPVLVNDDMEYVAVSARLGRGQGWPLGAAPVHVLDLVCVAHDFGPHKIEFVTEYQAPNWEGVLVTKKPCKVFSSIAANRDLARAWTGCELTV